MGWNRVSLCPRNVNLVLPNLCTTLSARGQAICALDVIFKQKTEYAVRFTSSVIALAAHGPTFCAEVVLLHEHNSPCRHTEMVAIVKADPKGVKKSFLWSLKQKTSLSSRRNATACTSVILAIQS